MQNGCCDFFSICFTQCFLVPGIHLTHLYSRDMDDRKSPFLAASSRLLSELRNNQQRVESSHSIKLGIIIWNPLILSARRCGLSVLENMTIPLMCWILDWRKGASKDDGHYLDTAAAMQLLFTLITRRKSVQFYPDSEYAKNKANFEFMLNWTVVILRCQVDPREKAFLKKAQTEAIKLLLALVAMGSFAGNLLSAEKMSKLLFSLQELHALLVDEDLRGQIASILTLLLDPEKLSALPSPFQRP
mmetsp:Transcript_20093/g.25905  ORF Transcript_20093/g.25905 Transcript_20093/m.25905 type:complete len:245 (+) Transcript_20093:18-752(+)